MRITKNHFFLLFYSVVDRLNFLNWTISPIFKGLKKKREDYYSKVLVDKKYANRWAEKYLKNFKSRPNPVALDHGCGRGRNSAILNNLGFSVYGIDTYRDPWWDNLPDNKFIVQSSINKNLPFQDHSVDLVLSSMVIAFFDDENLNGLIKEMARILKKDGLWLLIEPNRFCSAKNRMRLYYGRTPWSPDEIAEKTKTHFDHRFIGYEKFYSPFFPMLINNVIDFFGKGGVRMLELEDPWERYIPEKKRGLWVMELVPVDKAKHIAQPSMQSNTSPL